MEMTQASPEPRHRPFGDFRKRNVTKLADVYYQITALLPLRIVELGKSLSFPSASIPEAGDRWKSLSPSFMDDSIPLECVPVRSSASGPDPERGSSRPGSARIPAV